MSCHILSLILHFRVWLCPPYVMPSLGSQSRIEFNLQFQSAGSMTKCRCEGNLTKSKACLHMAGKRGTALTEDKIQMHLERTLGNMEQQRQIRAPTKIFIEIQNLSSSMKHNTEETSYVFFILFCQYIYVLSIYTTGFSSPSEKRKAIWKLIGNFIVIFITSHTENGKFRDLPCSNASL